MSKLVDILARELKVWPEDLPHALLTQSVNCGVNYTINNKLKWAMPTSPELADDWVTAIVSHSDWQAAVNALKAPPEDGHAICRCECGTTYQWPADASCPECNAWTGEGLPPVGTVCEYNNLEPHPVSVELKWSTVHIVAHDTQGSDVFAVFSSLSGYHGNRRPECFRPIRTPEQIATDLREKSVQQMLDDCSILSGIKANRRILCEELYSAGYRKFEITDDSDPA